MTKLTEREKKKGRKKINKGEKGGRKERAVRADKGGKGKEGARSEDIWNSCITVQSTASSLVGPSHH